MKVVPSVLQQPGRTSNAVEANGLIFTVQIPRAPAGTSVDTQGDIRAQARRTFENLRLALRAAGSDLCCVVQLTVFLVDSADAAGMNAVYDEFFGAPFPSRATVVVKELLLPGMRIEIVAQAHRLTAA